MKKMSQHTYISSIDYINGLAFDYAETFSFQRGEEYEERNERDDQEYETLKERRDKLNDLTTLAACGLSACPADAMSYVKTKVDIVTQAKGGQGVLREIADFVLSARGEMDKILKG